MGGESGPYARGAAVSKETERGRRYVSTASTYSRFNHGASSIKRKDVCLYILVFQESLTPPISFLTEKPSTQS